MKVKGLTIGKMCSERDNCKGCIYDKNACEAMMQMASHIDASTPEDYYTVTRTEFEVPVNVNIKPTIHIIYHAMIEKIGKIEVGDWIDLRSAENVKLKAGDFYNLELGVSMELPEGYEAIIAPRSSLFMKKGLIQTNGIGIIDNSYSGEDDIWHLPVYATRDCEIVFNERVCQFRIQENQPDVEMREVTTFSHKNRGGFGSTGGYFNEN